MIYIRKGVFETNSSSSHSIVITKDNKPTETIENSKMIDGGWHIDSQGVMDFMFEHDLEFGRSPFDILADWEGRLRYAIATYANEQDKINELEEICQRRIAGFVKFNFRKDHWEEKDYHGYVDHQSYGLLQHALSKYGISLEEFIFNDRYIVVIDGDEYNVFDTLIHTDMFNKENVEDIIPALYEYEMYDNNEEDEE